MSHLRPIKGLGHLISMVRYVMQDISVFACLVFIIMGSFALAFIVLFSHAIVDGDDSGFGRLYTALETLFYALLGEFDPEVISIESVASSSMHMIRYSTDPRMNCCFGFVHFCSLSFSSLETSSFCLF